ncbi:hypothetical protein [Spiroplasma poulsonii]|uniref:hypothetical protein n=1 Tax=Spiroplasma poulsonii TaxID=2138 RepID=UPI001F4D1AE3|nr:hypothetical protein [Spiroplasma poulsonii]UNF61858.1 hypothetical protein MNU24_08070 [Spiroplasma poulsonii]
MIMPVWLTTIFGVVVIILGVFLRELVYQLPLRKFRKFEERKKIKVKIRRDKNNVKVCIVTAINFSSWW